MTDLMRLSAIPNSLDVRELMEVKGGKSGTDDIICNGVSAVTCTQGTSAVATCAAGTSAVTIVIYPPITTPTEPPIEPPTDPWLET